MIPPRFEQLARTSMRRGAAILEQGVVSATAFAVTILLARGLGPESFGQFAIYLSVLLLSQTVQRSLILTPMIIHYFKDETGSQSWMKLSFMLALLLAVLGMVAAGLFAALDMVDLTVLSIICGLAVIPYLGFEFQRRVLYLMQRPQIALIASGVSALLQVGMAAAVILTGVGVVWALVGHAVAITLAWLTIVRVAAPMHTTSALPPLQLAHASRDSMIWNLAASVPYTLYNNAMPIIIGAVSTAAQVGLFSATRTFVAPVTALVAAIDGIEKPRASRAYSEQGVAGLRRALASNALVIVGVGLPYIAIGLFFPTQIAHLLLGEKYLLSAWSIQSWFIVSFLMLLGQPLETGLVIVRKTNWYFYSRLAAAIAAFSVYFLAPLGRGADAAILAVETAWGIAAISAAIMLYIALRRDAAQPKTDTKPDQQRGTPS